MKTLTTLILLSLISTTQAETFFEWALGNSSGDAPDVCDLMPEYGKALLGSNCFDWSRCPDCRIFCKLDDDIVQVWSNQQCSDLQKLRNSKTSELLQVEDAARRIDGSLYRHHWCAAHCSLGAPLPYDCADWRCD